MSIVENTLHIAQLPYSLSPYPQNSAILHEYTQMYNWAMEEGPPGGGPGRGEAWSALDFRT